MTKLTENEKRILRLTCNGYTSKQIGEKLFKSPRTIEDYRSKLYIKLNVKNKAQLITYVLQNNLLKKDDN